MVDKIYIGTSNKISV